MILPQEVNYVTKILPKVTCERYTHSGVNASANGHLEKQETKRHNFLSFILL